MIVYLLWFHQWESNELVGLFETEVEANRWRDFFLANPSEGRIYSMDLYANKNELTKRLVVETRKIGSLDKYLHIDNLKFLEYHEGKSNV